MSPRRPGLLAPLLASLLLTPAQGQQPPEDPHRRVQGITVSCQTWGWEWGSDAMVETLGEVRDLGANWVAIHPYARIGGDGEVRAGRLGDAPPVWLTRPVAEAHRRGLKVLVKPHLAYWGSPFSWRGEIRFQSPAEWERFWQGYRAWILRLVELCPDADAFAVGTELDKTLDHEARWRSLIAEVRARTRAPLTYAANWTDFERVGFWDALDVIGIQAYFPLVTHQGAPSPAELVAGWQGVLERVGTYARARRRQVLFTELGYDRSLQAAARPWERGRDADPRAEEVQRACLEVALRAIADSDVVVGAFLWKWFPGDSRGEDFLLSAPGPRQVIRQAWRR